MTAGARLRAAVAAAVLACVALLPPAFGVERRGDVTHLTVSYVPYLSFAPLFIALDDGHFARHGLEVELIRLTGNTDALPAVAQGRIDVAPGYMAPGYLNLMARGADVRFVADKGHVAREGCAYRAFLARRDLVESGGLDRLEQLAGKRVATERTSPSYYDLDRLVELAGLSIDDIVQTDVPSAAKIDAFASGAIDLTTVSEPWVTRILDEGHAVLWKPLRDVVPDYQHSFVLFGPNLLRKDREAGVTFMMAYLEAVAQYNEGATPRNVEIIAARTGLDPDLVARCCWAPVRPDGRMNVESVLVYQDWAIERGLMDARVPVERFWDPSFVDEAARRLRESR